jgi:predicted nucleic acid-binding protein
MPVLVDTCVWSEALRKPLGNPETIGKLTRLIQNGEAVLIGPIRQELLSGIKNKSHFDTLSQALRFFDDVPITRQHYEYAAELFNLCRENGVSGTAIDLLICAVSKQERCPIFTTDRDFESFSRVIGLEII